MRRLTIVCAGIAVAGLTAWGAPTVRPERPHVFQRENALGTSFEMKVAAQSAASAEGAEKAALDEIRRQAAILSSWNRAAAVLAEASVFGVGRGGGGRGVVSGGVFDLGALAR